MCAQTGKSDDAEPRGRTPARRIAVLDDDQAQREAIVAGVEGAGHRASAYASPRKFMADLHHDTFDLLVLDWNMPEADGREVLTHVRKVRADMPVLMVTCRGEDEDVIEGLGAGADDYISKPLNVAVFRARLEALLRRLGLRVPDGIDVVEVGPYRINPSRGMASFEGEPIALTNREIALAMLFFANLDRAISRRYVIETLWGRLGDPQARSLDTHVARLRAKLRLGARSGVRLTTLYGFGYRLETVGQEDLARGEEGRG